MKVKITHRIFDYRVTRVIEVDCPEDADEETSDAAFDKAIESAENTPLLDILKDLRVRDVSTGHSASVMDQEDE